MKNLIDGDEDIERLCLDELQSLSRYPIIRRPQIIGYFPSGYISELKLLIDFVHNENSGRDIQKCSDFKTNDYLYFRIGKSQWEYEKNRVIDEFKSILKR